MNHTGNVVTCNLLIFVQNASIIWFSKRQNTVESTTFRSKLVASRICKDLIVAFQYKLQMFGVPINGQANVFCDNHGVVKNVSIPEFTLIKNTMQLTTVQFERQWQLGFCELEGRYGDGYGGYAYKACDE